MNSVISCQSMSDPYRSSSSADASSSKKRAQNGPANLRPLAPKPVPPPPTPQSLTIRTAGSLPSSASSSTASKRRSPVACSVCYRVGCQLPTHTAFVNLSHSRSSSENSPDKSVSSNPQRDPVFTSSYAYKLAQQYANTDVTSSEVDHVYTLPLDVSMNTPEMHRLFHLWFKPRAENTSQIPRPQDMVGDLLWSPFLLPATQDPLLCLSVLAASAARLTHNSNQPQFKVTSLTLLGQAIQQMRERINSSPTDISDTTIAAATFLWMANMFLEDTAAMTSHRRSVYAFIETRGGMHKLGLVGSVATFVRWADIAHSFILPVRCHYLDPPDPGPPSKSPPARYGTYWEQETSAASMEIDADIRKACRDTCRVLEYLEHVEGEGLSGNEYVQLTQRLCVIYTAGSVLRARSYNNARVNECIIVAIGLLQFHCLCGLDNLKLASKTNAARLEAAIKATGGPSFWQTDLNLLIWLLVVVVTVPFRSKEETWCLPFLCRVVVARFGDQGKLKSTWKESLRACLHRFVWCDLRLEESFRDTCRAIQKEIEDEESSDDETDNDE